ncbi:MAG: hypothetical protein JSS02_32920 [Planctomycetes bacterium]|nr:hypothetical protein [Planctomycetota bacterium]
MTSFPKGVSRPRLVGRTPANLQDLHNTDPCVFGDCFRYCNCRQGSYAELQELGPGSIILFGSPRSGQFVLDTVFVVARAVRYQRGRSQDLVVPAWYRMLALDPGCCDPKNPEESYCYYEGATFEKPVAGMFSFFPCLPGERSLCARGFERPTVGGVALYERLGGKNSGGAFCTVISGLSEAAALWQTVAVQVLNQQLCLGITAEVPAVLPE